MDDHFTRGRRERFDRMIRSSNLNHFFRGKKSNSDEVIQEQFDKLLNDDRKYLDFLMQQTKESRHEDLEEDEEDY